jgi:hypothetical protein
MVRSVAYASEFIVISPVKRRGHQNVAYKCTQVVVTFLGLLKITQQKIALQGPA